jgi:manganese transport protein
MRIGPGLITACVVIGPGSIVTSSKIGAVNGFSMLWVVVVSVLFMMVFTVLGARLGTVAASGPCDLIRQKSGRALAVLVGLSVFFISAAFQSGNNIGVAAAFEEFVASKRLVACLVVGFNAVAISFLFAFKNLYRVVERLMMVFVGVMLVSFAVNLFALRPDPVEMAKGLIPTVAEIDLTLLGLVGTTLVISAAFYQAYLVRQKGWTVAQLRNGLLDARIGSVIMALITIMLMSTAAAGFFGNRNAPELSSPVAVAEALKATFGSGAKLIFCFGLFSAAYSSFIVNSMIGGFILSDGLGLGCKATDIWPRIMTTVALLTGMIIALASMLWNFDRQPTLIAAQAVTVIGSPLVAGVLLWLTSRKDIMGEHVNGRFTNALAGAGVLLLVAMACYTAFVKLPKEVQDYRDKYTAAEVELPAGDDQE